MNLKIYHNPHCSKSRETLLLLHARGLKPQVIEYINTPPSIAELNEILKSLNDDPMAIIRTNEDLYEKMGLSSELLSREEVVEILHRHPILLQRPIVIKDNKAVIGRPPEAVLSILD